MAAEIKNKIVLEGEAQYKKAMADIRAEQRELSSALRASAAEFKANANDQQAATRYGEALKASYDNQAAALETMRAHLAEVEAAYGTNSREAQRLRTDINNMRTQTARTEQQMNTFRDGLDNVADSAEDAGSTVGSAQRAIAGIGSAAAEAGEGVQGLAAEIGSMVGEKLISFKLAETALSALESGIEWAWTTAMERQNFEGLAYAMAGNDALGEARVEQVDALMKSWAAKYDRGSLNGKVASMDTTLGNAGVVDEDAKLTYMNYALTQEKAFGADAAQSVKDATTVARDFGISIGAAFDLMTDGYQNADDGGVKMRNMLDKNSNYFKLMGYDADDMFATIKTASNDAQLGKDSNLNKGMSKLIDSVTMGGKEATEALKQMGIYTADLAVKAQAGGETSAAAYQLVLTSLLSITDEVERNKLGSALFGEEVWRNSGGNIAQVLLSGFNQTIEADGSTQYAMEHLLGGFEDGFEGAKERIGQDAAKAMQPVVDVATDVVNAFNQGYDESGMSGAIEAAAVQATESIEPLREFRDTCAEIGELGVDGVAQAMADASAETLMALPENAANAWDAYIDTVSNAPDTIGSWFEQVTGSAQKSAEGVGEAGETAVSKLEATKTALQAQIASLEAEIEAAFASGNMEKAYEKLAQRDELTSQLEAFMQEYVAKYDEMGQDAATALSDKAADVGTAAGDMTQSGIDAVTDKNTDMQSAGDELGAAAVEGVNQQLVPMNQTGQDVGAAGVDGAKMGLSDMRAAGIDAAAGLSAGLETGVEAAESAGRRAGQAYERAFRKAVNSHSPSRAMMAAGEDTVEGLLIALNAGEEEVYARGAAMGQALLSGYGATRADGGMDAMQGMGGMNGQTDIVGALVDALSAVGLYVDGERLGALTAGGVSRQISRSGAQTLSGRAASVRGW